MDYGYNIGEMKAFSDEEMTIEINVKDISKDTLAKILGGIPIVKCKDCKFCYHYTDGYLDTDGHLECRLLAEMKPIPTTYVHLNGDDFCSYGQLR